MQKLRIGLFALTMACGVVETEERWMCNSGDFHYCLAGDNIGVQVCTPDETEYTECLSLAAAVSGIPGDR